MQVERWVEAHPEDETNRKRVLLWAARKHRDTELENLCCESLRWVRLLQGCGDPDRYQELDWSDVDLDDLSPLF